VQLRRALTLTAALAVAGLAASGCAEQSAGVRVGDDVVSESDLMQELDVYGEGPATQRPVGELGSSYTQTFAGQVVRQRIIFMLVAQIFDEEGRELNSADRQNTIANLREQMQDGFDALPDDYRDDFVDDVAMYNALITDMGEDEFQQALVDRAMSVDIEVSSRFGTWDEDELVVQPPPGASPARGATEPTTGAPVG
jgi:hypothetical protein